jgi:hypothetical protein
VVSFEGSKDKSRHTVTEDTTEILSGEVIRGLINSSKRFFTRTHIIHAKPGFAPLHVRSN